jgi:hypothetical protein
MIPIKPEPKSEMGGLLEGEIVDSSRRSSSAAGTASAAGSTAAAGAASAGIAGPAPGAQRALPPGNRRVPPSAAAHAAALSLAIREALVLPAIFLTVAFGGGFRLSRTTGQFVFLVPSLMALVLALLLLGVLYRGRILIPELLMHARRSTLANCSGLLVLGSLFAASAQVFNTATPEAGLLQFVFDVFFLLLLWNTIAARPDRQRLLQSLLVVFGGSFLLKYVVLGALYDPQGGLTKRVLLTLLEGVTLGGLVYESPAPVTGYVAFFTILLFLVGLILLPQGQHAHAQGRPGQGNRGHNRDRNRDQSRDQSRPAYATLESTRSNALSSSRPPSDPRRRRRGRGGRRPDDR